MDSHHGRLGNKNICSQMVSCLLNEDQRGGVFKCVITFRLKTELDLLRRMLTGDVLWIFEYNPLTKRRSLEWKSATSLRPKKAIKVKSEGDIDCIF